MTDIHELFCKNLKIIMKKRGLSQGKLARLMGYNIKYIQQLLYGYKDGTQWPRPPKMMELAEALECDTIDFFKPLK